MSSKYGNKPTMIDGIRFASLAESRRYQHLKLRLYAKEIRNLQVQPCFKLVVNNVQIGKYYADFSYEEAATNELTVEDVKAKITMTPVYKLKKRLMKAVHNIDVKEVF